MAHCCKSLGRRGRLRGWLAAVCLLVSVGTGYGQEVCNNGLDDDGDGLTDLQDTADCRCRANRAAFVPSLIPNPSFERYDQCPGGWSELNSAQNWVQATDATTDYLNTCNFTFKAGPAGLLPFPDGNGAVGGYFAGDWKEYVGTRLAQPLVAGRRYRLTLQIAASYVTPDTQNDTCRASINGQVPPVAITLFGSANASALPAGTFYCPIAADRSWQVLGDSLYTPLQAWGSLTIDFIPRQTIRAVMLGAPCLLPEGYPESIRLVSCIPYFYYDNLVLNEERFFEYPVSVSAEPCLRPPLLAATVNFAASAAAQGQWYRNGAALAGKQDSLLQLSAPGDTASYQYAITDSGRCQASPALPVRYGAVRPSITPLSDTLLPLGGQISLTAQPPGRSYTWRFCDGTTYQGASPTFTLADTGRCCVTLSTEQDGCPDSASRCFRVLAVPPVVIPNLITPNADGLNDVFTVRSRGLKALRGSIYSRWGRHIYSWTGTDGSWDGTTDAGPAQAGVYFYRVSYTGLDDKEHSARGFVEVVGGR